MKFEVLINDQHVVLKQGCSTIWWPKIDKSTINLDSNNSTLTTPKIKPKFQILQENSTCSFDDFTCYGTAFGFIGLFNQDKLILVKQAISIGRLPFGTRDEVFKIQRICIIPLVCNKGESLPDLGLEMCGRDTCTKPEIVTPINQPFVQFKDSLLSEESSVKLVAPSQPAFQPSNSVQRTWNQIKMTASNVKPRVTTMINNATNQNLQQNKAEEREKLDRRLTEEVYKMFNDTHSFYYSLNGDLTNSVQRQQKFKQQQKSKETSEPIDIRLIPLWKRVDDRFFWNKYMLQPIIDIFEDEELHAKYFSPLWIVPIIQGFIQIEKCCFDLNENFPVGLLASSRNQSNTSGETKCDDDGPKVLDPFLETRDYYWMALISRRSRFRAGTRYKKRGLDETGTCANYVETEQIFNYSHHTVSFVCIRGSVPLFWSQPGYKYRPPPLMERSENENQEAFRKHFENEFQLYQDNVVAINLIEHTGREKALCDAYKHHVILMDDPRLTFVTFDFHDYCRGMKFENVSILIEKIYDYIKDMRYCWTDNDGSICEQLGVFRVNCVDCLDRTNIVMTAIAKTVMDIQLVRLGLLPPEGQLSANSRRVFQLMWARNGDTISRQYAGTAALKSDYTRTGERKISGVVRDGYNSANRYYLNRFKDAFRQAVIDIMQGNPVTDPLGSPVNEKLSPRKAAMTSAANNDQEYHERIKMVIEDCKKILVPEDEVILGGWPLVDADPVTGTPLSTLRSNNEIPECEMDIVLILTKDCYYVADYDDQTDRIIKYQKVFLEDLEKIEIGAEPNYPNGPLSSIRNQSCPTFSYAIRFHYTIGNQTGYFHMFRSTNTRFFNNMAIPIRTREEALESLKAICESFKVALSVKSLNVPFLEVGRLERRKSKRILTASFKTSSDSSSGENFKMKSNVPVSDNSYVVNSKKLFTGVYTHFSRLRGKLTGNSNGQGQGNIATSRRPNLEIVDQGRKFSDDYECESDEEDSSGKSMKKANLKVGKENIAERTLSSDMSDGSEFGSEQVLPPISEICSPCLDDVEPILTAKESMDRVLESCGILVTSPPLRFTPTDEPIDLHSDSITPTTIIPKKRPHHLSPNNNLQQKSVLHDIDDFVLDSMKNASLRQILRKAVSHSQVSLIPQTDLQNLENNKISKNTTSRHLSSNRCIFNSQLALDSIMSQPMKKTDLILSSSNNNSSNNNKHDKIFFTHSTDSLNRATDSICLDKTDENELVFNYPLISSSSFAALSYHAMNDGEENFKSLGSESISGRLLEQYLDKKHRDSGPDSMVGSEFLDQDNSLLSSGLITKETSLSFSDLAFTTQQSGLKTSRSSNTLQITSGGFNSLNLPPASSVSNISSSGDESNQISTSNASGNTVNDRPQNYFTSSLGVKKDFVLSPLTRITKGITQTIHNTIDLTKEITDDDKTILNNDRKTRCNIIEI